MKNEISKLDQLYFNIIRESVSDLIKKASLHDRKGLRVLDVAPQVYNGAKDFFKFADVYTLDIDINSGANFIADICSNNSDLIPSDFFDVIICTEVLEHTLNPFHAVNEIKRILKPNSHVYVSTPFNFRIHGPLPDCWRFTEHGLKSLFSTFKYIDIEEIKSDDRFLMPIHYRTIAVK